MLPRVRGVLQLCDVPKLRFNLVHATDGTPAAACALSAWNEHFAKYEGMTLVDKLVLHLRVGAAASRTATGGRCVVADSGSDQSTAVQVCRTAASAAPPAAPPPHCRCTAS